MDYSTVELTDEQQKVYLSILDDFYSGEKVITLGGLAGTGKSEIVRKLSDAIPTACVCAFTGKAANVLRQKDIISSTIHSSIYIPHKVKNELGGDDVFFELNPNVNYGAFIVDEASMVPEEIHNDLMSFGVPIIYVGDHGQLEPIGDSFNLMEKPKYKLETIHRNSGDIVKFAAHLRLGGSASTFQTTDGSVEIVGKANTEMYLDADQVLVAFNNTRVKLNENIRKELGKEDLIEDGERIICLMNNRNVGLFNGQQGRAYNNRYDRKKKAHVIDFDDGDDIYLNVKYDPLQFGEVSKLPYVAKSKKVLFDYAYCITAHKAQGGQWDNVLVIEQKCPLWSHQRWCYTVASRAVKKLVWAMNK